jgi:hypothetical protein
MVMNERVDYLVAMAGWGLMTALMSVGCEGELPARQTPVNERSAEKDGEKPPVADAKRLGKDLFFERTPKDERRVYVTASVCLREGNFGLECLLCRKGTKEHESILSTNADGRLIHAALQAAGAQPGSPVQFDPQFKSPAGARIKVSLRFERQGKMITVPAQQWILHGKSKKTLENDWVFAGSQFLKDPDDPKKPPVYLAAAEGSLICVSNVPTAMLDLPIKSPKSLEDREFAPNTERIPELETKVVVILEPAAVGKKK